MNSEIILEMIKAFNEQDFQQAAEGARDRPRLHSAIVQHFAGLVTRLGQEHSNEKDAILRLARHGKYDDALKICQSLKIAAPEEIDDEQFDVEGFKNKIEQNENKKKQRMERESSQQQLTQGQQQAGQQPADLGPAPGQSQYPQSMAMSLIEKFSNDYGSPSGNQIKALKKFLGVPAGAVVMKSASYRSEELRRSFQRGKGER